MTLIRHLFAWLFFIAMLLSGLGAIMLRGGSAFLILTALFCVLWLAVRPRKYRP